MPSPTPEASHGIKWTAGTVFWTLGVFLLAGLAGGAFSVRCSLAGMSVQYVIAGKTPAESMRRLGQKALGNRVDLPAQVLRETAAMQRNCCRQIWSPKLPRRGSSSAHVHRWPS